MWCTAMECFFVRFIGCRRYDEGQLCLQGVDYTAGKNIRVACPDVWSYRKLALVYTLKVCTLYGFQSSSDLSSYDSS